MKHALIEKSTREEVAIAEEAAGWLIDAIATATQDRRFLLGDPECDVTASESIVQNSVIACLRAIHRSRP